MSAHEPAPWGVVTFEKGRYYAHIIGPDGAVVARLPRLPADFEIRSEANAKLISAAPVFSRCVANMVFHVASYVKVSTKDHQDAWFQRLVALAHESELELRKGGLL